MRCKGTAFFRTLQVLFQLFFKKYSNLFVLRHFPVLFHDFLVVFLCTLACIVHSSVPESDGAFDVVGGVVPALYQPEHLSAFPCAEPVFLGKAFVVSPTLQYVVAVLYEYWGNLHWSA